MQRTAKISLAIIALALLCLPALEAQIVQKMSLTEMVQSADRIFRGQLLGVSSGTVAIGGGELPTMTYRLRVDESFKGEYATTKGDETYAEVKVVGSIKPRGKRVGDMEHLSSIIPAPRLTVGEDYVLLVTAPSAAGLSTTVGLGQGNFHLKGEGDNAIAVNELGNRGLSANINSAVSYAELAAELRATVGQ